MTTTVDVSEVQHQLSELLSPAKAGHEVIIVEGNTPVVRLVAVASSYKQRVAGLYQGAIWASDDFD